LNEQQECINKAKALAVPGVVAVLTADDLKPVKLTGTMAFMFETRFPQHVTKYAAELEGLQENYSDCWTPLEKNFTGET